MRVEVMCHLLWAWWHSNQQVHMGKDLASKIPKIRRTNMHSLPALFFSVLEKLDPSRGNVDEFREDDGYGYTNDFSEEWGDILDGYIARRTWS